MAIVREYFKTRNDGVKLYKTYSSENFRILQVETNIVFSSAIDIETANYTYRETDEKIEEDKSNELELKAHAYDIITGEVE